jgi:hypothetical protein
MAPTLPKGAPAKAKAGFLTSKMQGEPTLMAPL